MSDNEADILILGAGPAGLMAALRAAERGCRVRLLEKSPKAGVKILMSGGTRCNLTHDTDPRGIIAAFGPAGRWLRNAVYDFPPAELIRQFNRYGVATKVEPGEKVFPASDSAVDVRDALLRMVAEVGVDLRLREPAIDLQRCGDAFSVRTGNAVYQAPRLIITVGGQSYPGCGTTGDGYRWMAALGHRIVPPRPALVPVLGGDPWMRELSGITIDEATVAVRQQGVRRPLESRTASLLIAHFGFSGPAAMDVSRAITAVDSADSVHLEINFAPALNAESAVAWIEQARAAGPKQKLAPLLAQRLPRRLAEAIARHVAADSVPLAEQPRARLRAAAELVVRCVQPIHGTKGFAKAEVTAGGVDLAEVNPRSMESRIVPGLYIAGELLDVDGLIGGYNFQAAFSTGHVAGKAAASSLQV